MTNNDEYITLNTSDNTSMKAYIAVPDDKNKSYPGLILLQEAGGVNTNLKNIAKKFAKDGYIVIAPELFHRTSKSEFALSVDVLSMEEIMPHAKALTKEGMSADITASWDWLQKNEQIQHDNIACLGYCLGGRAAFLANTILPFKAAVSFYGGGITPDLIKDADSLHADMLFFWGGLDKYIPNEQIEEITSSLKKSNKHYTNIVFSYADHGFTRQGATVYNHQADTESWSITCTYLKNKLFK